MSTQTAPQNGLSDALRLLGRSGLVKAVAAVLALSLIVALAFVSQTEADRRAHRNTTVAAGSTDNGGAAAGGSGDVGGATATTAAGGAGAASGTGTAAAGGATTGAAGSGTAAGAAAKTAGSAGGTAAAAAATGCPDANPAIGITCDQILVGGITVLSGPLGIYGEQGLQGGQAWLSYYNAVYAPAHHLRKEKLIYYDDHGADPAQDALLTQKLVEQDHVFDIAGMPAPQGGNPYLLQHRVPMIGDLGLNPISFQSPVIFPTAPNTATTASLQAQIVAQKFHPKKVGAIISPLPGEDPTPTEQAETQAYAKYGASVVFEVMDTSESDCNSHLLKIKGATPDFLELPAPSTNFLLCIQAAQSQGYYPGGTFGQGLVGWQGGSGIDVEMQQCGSTCNGMYSHGSIYLDPRVYKNGDPNWGMDLYNVNMAKYAPNVDKTSIISENYYVAGVLNSKVYEAAAATAPYLTREHIISVANGFTLDTGMGYTVDWKDAPNNPNAHSGTNCGYAQYAGPGAGGKIQWITIPTKVCV